MDKRTKFSLRDWVFVFAFGEVVTGWLVLLASLIFATVISRELEMLYNVDQDKGTLLSIGKFQLCYTAAITGQLYSSTCITASLILFEGLNKGQGKILKYYATFSALFFIGTIFGINFLLVKETSLNTGKNSSFDVIYSRFALTAFAWAAFANCFVIRIGFICWNLQQKTEKNKYCSSALKDVSVEDKKNGKYIPSATVLPDQSMVKSFFKTIKHNSYKNIYGIPFLHLHSSKKVNKIDSMEKV